MTAHPRILYYRYTNTIQFCPVWSGCYHHHPVLSTPVASATHRDDVTAAVTGTGNGTHAITKDSVGYAQATDNIRVNPSS